MASLLVAGMFLSFAGLTQAAPVKAVVKSVSGTVEFAPPGSTTFSALQKGQELAIGSTVRTGDDGKAVIMTTPGTAIEVGNGSNLKFTELAYAKSGSTVTQQKAHLELTTGVVSALIDHNTPKVTDFSIQTPQGAAAARGTFYAVYVIHGKTYVGVKNGKVGAMATGGGI